VAFLKLLRTPYPYTLALALLVLRRATAEDVHLAFALDDFAIATNGLNRRSDLHNFLTKNVLSFAPAILTPVIHDSDPVA
jgi:hypothetical protein